MLKLLKYKFCQIELKFELVRYSTLYKFVNLIELLLIVIKVDIKFFEIV